MSNIVNLTPEEKRILLAKKLQQKAKSIPLSFAQQRLWFLDQLEPGKAIYNVPVALLLTGPLHRDALEQSLNEIVRRHEVLRTIFRTVNGQPIQIIAPTSGDAAGALVVPLTTIGQGRRDSGLPLSALTEEEVVQLATQEIRRPFDLEHGPLIRASLFQCGEEEQLFVLVMHHIVSDGWSIEVLLRELATLYEAFSQRPACLASGSKLSRMIRKLV